MQPVHVWSDERAKEHITEQSNIWESEVSSDQELIYFLIQISIALSCLRFYKCSGNTEYFSIRPGYFSMYLYSTT